MNAYKRRHKDQHQEGIKTKIKKGMFSVYESLIGVSAIASSEQKHQNHLPKIEQEIFDFGTMDEISEIPHFNELENSSSGKRKFLPKNSNQKISN